MSENPYQSPKPVSDKQPPSKPPIPRLTKAGRFFSSLALTWILTTVSCWIAGILMFGIRDYGMPYYGLLLVGVIFGTPGGLTVGLIGMRFQGDREKWNEVLIRASLLGAVIAGITFSAIIKMSDWARGN